MYLLLYFTLKVLKQRGDPVLQTAKRSSSSVGVSVLVRSEFKRDDELLLSASLLCFTDVLNVVTCYICSPGVCVQPQLSLSLQTSGSSVWLLQPDASSRPPASSGTERRNEGVHH